MKPWMIALSIGIAVIVLAILLKVAHPFLVLLVFIAVIAVVYLQARRSSRPEQRTGTELLGLRRETGDPFGILAYPVSLFARAAEPQVEDLVWGSWRGLDVHVFALSFSAPSLAELPAERASFSCAMARTDGSVPAVVAEPQIFLTRLSRPPALEPIASDEADPTEDLSVWAEDETAARALVDGSMREWLRSLDLRWGFEARGQIAVLYGPRPAEPDLVGTLETLRDLLERLPRAQGAAGPQPPG
jgi:hypothetical protein